MSRVEMNFFGGYCYGPVDLLKVQKDSNSMRLVLRTAGSGFAYADYNGCAYWRLGMEQRGKHFPLVQRFSADELLSRPDSDTIVSLRRNTDDVESMLRDWENEGLKFYIHFASDPGSEYMIAAREMHYRELG